jgi:2-oxoacid:acceptor oxidoreductase gamma subunit (pyruvate/2-ketoisovalerate family)
MIRIRFHGRGGQGAVIASELLANAAFKEGKEVQAFPFFGVERRGAPVTAFTKIDTKPIRDKSEIYEPDYIIVLDQSLIQAVNPAQGLKTDGMMLINTTKNPKALGLDYKGKIATVDANTIAIKHQLGSKQAPIVNSSILGAFAKASGLIKLDSLVSSIMESAPTKKQENANAAKEAYESVKIWGAGE